MQFTRPQPFAEAVAKLGDRSPIGVALSSAQWRRVPVALRERAFFSAKVQDARFLSDSKRFLDDFLKGTVEELPNGKKALKAGGRAQFIEQLQRYAINAGLGPLDPRHKGTIRDVTSEPRLALIFDTSTKSVEDFGYWKQGQDPDLLDAFPAQRFIRVRTVHAPRPWHDANTGAVRLKTDLAFWISMNRDFGVPWGPWGFGSGMDVEDVDREEAEADGLLKPNDKLQPVDKDLNDGLQASLRGLDPRITRKLQGAFGDQAVVDGDAIRWRGPSDQSADSVDLPKSPAVPQPEPGTSLARQPERATPAEAKIVNDPKETGFIYDPTGRIKFRQRGDASSVRWTPAQRTALPDSISAHNHPSGTSFSFGDVVFALGNDVAELRVITASYDGRAHLHRLIRPPGGWPKLTQYELQIAYLQAQTKAQAIVLHQSWPSIKAAEAAVYGETIKELQSANPGFMIYEDHAL